MSPDDARYPGAEIPPQGKSCNTFAFYAFRFVFLAVDPLFFPPGKSGNIVRGAFGTIFRRLACLPECAGVRTCAVRQSCPYARIFEPSAAGLAPSGLADPPRPFVFRAAHLDGRRLSPGESFHFDVHIFELRDPALAYFVLSFAELAREGLGPGRGRAELRRVDQLDLRRAPVAQVFDGTSFCLQGPLPPTRLSLERPPEPVSALRVIFRTPTELKEGGAVVLRPEFGVLFARVRDRLSTLRALYGDGPLQIDFRALGERARQVRMVGSNLRWVEVSRRSGRTGQSHPLGGFVGEVEYEGELTEFVPYLKAACWTGVGRQTVWGKGEIEIEPLRPAKGPG